MKINKRKFFELLRSKYFVYRHKRLGWILEQLYFLFFAYPLVRFTYYAPFWLFNLHRKFGDRFIFNPMVEPFKQIFKWRLKKEIDRIVTIGIKQELTN